MIDDAFSKAASVSSTVSKTVVCKETQRAASGNRHRRGGHRDVVRSLIQGVRIMTAEGVPETMQLSANRFDVLLGCRSAVLGVLDELGPSSLACN